MSEYDRGILWKNDMPDVKGDTCFIKTGVVDRIYQYFDEVNETPVVYHWKYRMDEF